MARAVLSKKQLLFAEGSFSERDYPVAAGDHPLSGGHKDRRARINPRLAFRSG